MTEAEKDRNWQVVPYVGTWIEIHTWHRWQKGAGSRSLRGNVDRNTIVDLNDAVTLSRSLRGNVDRNILSLE